MDWNEDGKGQVKEGWSFVDALSDKRLTHLVSMPLLLNRAVAVGEASSPELAIMERPAQCPTCGNIYMADSDFCRHCGRKRDAFDDFREFCTEIISAASENLCNYYEREIQHLTTDLVTCRTQLGRCAELLGQQLAKEQTYRDIIDKLSESSMQVLQNVSSPPPVDDAVKRQLHQMLEAMHHQSSSCWQDEIGQLHAHKELTENHLMTSAELQNQAEAVKKELENILALLKEPPVRTAKPQLPGYTPNAALAPPLGYSQGQAKNGGQAVPLPRVQPSSCGPSFTAGIPGTGPWRCGAAADLAKPNAFHAQVGTAPGVDPAARTKASDCMRSSMSGGAGSLLDEHIDPDYQPSEKVEEYAEWLGMDLEKDRDLFWIALPAPWKPCESEDGEIFYFNFETGESVWDHPCDEHYRKVYEKYKAKKEADRTPGNDDSKRKDKKDKKEKKRKSGSGVDLLDGPPKMDLLLV
ncbi:Centrosomal protein of 164 kDa [Symbiodinium microadriaticum]|uniref:Centrosomal protein of 164 kDa n=1 Tax=Symbiodinium microadriaticum TaxID=2951 RepID=A0A1Q9D4D0_SYMMI|nr:Centrosomal protein of 164 kDa [Symbiodinium microadriaticum]